MSYFLLPRGPHSISHSVFHCVTTMTTRRFQSLACAVPTRPARLPMPPPLIDTLNVSDFFLLDLVNQGLNLSETKLSRQVRQENSLCQSIGLGLVP